MNVLMAILLAIFIGIMVVVGFLGLASPDHAEAGPPQHPPPARPNGPHYRRFHAQRRSSSPASFATGDTISSSIRNASIEGLGTIDEVLTPARGAEDFGPVYISSSRFDWLQEQLAGFDAIDGMTPYIAETAPTC